MADTTWKATANAPGQQVVAHNPDLKLQATVAHGALNPKLVGGLHSKGWRLGPLKETAGNKS